ncbi:MAG: molecular chaperone TorD family protein [Thiomargarita sp.]|nr:molecular chaperone TorD family protein [Thiomargarita sp.]
MENTLASKQQQLYSCFSFILDYPTLDLSKHIQNCVNLLKTDYPETIESLENFQIFIKETPIGKLEEIYTATFDINPACHIFAGHILFGESFKRGSFMAALEEEYQERNFDKGKELADHIPILFRFLNQVDLNDTFLEELIADCLIPVFEKMNANFQDDSTNPYVPILRIISVMLEKIANTFEKRKTK